MGRRERFKKHISYKKALMSLNPYTIDSLININTGCSVCEDTKTPAIRGLCCDLVQRLQKYFRDVLIVSCTCPTGYGCIYDEEEQKEVEKIVIQTIVVMLWGLRHDARDNENPLSIKMFKKLPQWECEMIAESVRDQVKQKFNLEEVSDAMISEFKNLVLLLKKMV